MFAKVVVHLCGQHSEVLCLICLVEEMNLQETVSFL